MNLTEIKQTLEENFNKETSDSSKKNIIFWYDAEAEFLDDINELELEDAKILHLTGNNSFYIKHLLEKEDLKSNYLIYSPNPKPTPRENWLLDIEKYSGEFSTDKATVIMRNLGVKDESLRGVFKSYIKFFGNKERYKRFASYNIDHFTEENIHIAVLSTLCKLSIADFEQVVKTLLMEETKEENKHMEAIGKFGNEDAFWDLVESNYGYDMAEKSLEQLMIMFLVTDLSYKLEGKIPTSWEKFLSSKKADAIVFISHFMNHSQDSKVYNTIARKMEEKLNVKKYIKKWDIENYLSCDTFISFDEEIITWLIQNLLEDIGEYERYRKIINRRRTTHWFPQLSHEYDSIYYAMEILRLENELQKTIKGSTAYEVVDKYTKTYYLFDLFYRKFYLAYDKVDNKDKFIELVKIIENTYNHWYLQELSMKWSSRIDEELSSDIRIDGLVKQQDFYKKFINPHINKDERVFVIISDAFRYDVAKEFTDILNRDRRGKAELDFMQGVIPSYTKLGMASLLPHETIEVTDNGEVIVDGINSAGTDNRQKILLKYHDQAVAISYNDMRDFKRPEYKENFDGKKLIYIYHNVIDAIGDKASTERDIFDAVERTFEDLSTLTKELVNNVSATNIYITADHGFIYSRSAIEEFNKVARLKVNKVDAGRRFMLTKESVSEQGIFSLSMKYLLGQDSDLHAVIPKGVTRFKVQGAGDNYVHGGVSLQEIIIPVIKFKNIRNDEFKPLQVEVNLASISRKITNRITFFEFFQKQKVEDKKLPITLRLYFEDEEGNRISNENIVIADSRSSKPEDRTYREKFTLKDQSYDKTKKYYLVMDDESKDEVDDDKYKKISFIIDLAIMNDFGF